MKSSDVGLTGASGLPSTLLGGSWVVTSGVISKVTILITLVGGLITPLLSSPRQENMKLVEEERIFLQKRLA